MASSCEEVGAAILGDCWRSILDLLPCCNQLNEAFIDTVKLRCGGSARLLMSLSAWHCQLRACIQSSISDAQLDIRPSSPILTPLSCRRDKNLHMNEEIAQDQLKWRRIQKRCLRPASLQKRSIWRRNWGLTLLSLPSWNSHRGLTWLCREESSSTQKQLTYLR